MLKNIQITINIKQIRRILIRKHISKIIKPGPRYRAQAQTTRLMRGQKQTVLDIRSIVFGHVEELLDAPCLAVPDGGAADLVAFLVRVGVDDAEVRFAKDGGPEEF